jgi:hypothetical protein
MSISQLLSTMCADLSDADMNAIRKVRGFNTSETASRDSFASFFVSSIGVQEAMRLLTTEEIVTLHLLQQVGEVSISFFERLYGSAGQTGKPYYGTFTQQFRPTFDAVKKGLVRKGLLIMAEVKMRGESVQMERWRFALPSEFAAYLPPILQTRLIDEPGETSDRAARKKLLQLLGGLPGVTNDTNDIHIKNGSIYLGEQVFTTLKLIEWQTQAWQSAIGSQKTDVEGSVGPVEAVRGLFADLVPGEWVVEKDLGPILKIFSYGYKIPQVEKLLQQGWEFGGLSRLRAGTDFYYRLAPKLSPADSVELSSPDPWLQIPPERNNVVVDLRLIPFYQLELLNVLMNLTVKEGNLLANPALVKLSRALPEQRQSSLSGWLAKKIPAFREVLDRVNARWGKTLLHENLLVARVRVLSLRVQLERELGENIVVLSEHFIAFPAAYRSGVEKVLKKSGFVMKTVKP